MHIVPKISAVDVTSILCSLAVGTHLDDLDLGVFVTAMRYPDFDRGHTKVHRSLGLTSVLGLESRCHRN